MALTKITPQMFDTSAAGHDFNIDNGTFVVDASANRVGIGTATPSTLLDVDGTATATTFVGALTGNVTGTILTAAQTNITSVGTLSSLAVNSGTTNISATFTSTDGLGGIQLADNSGNVELVANGDNFEVRNAGGAAKLTIASTGAATFTGNIGLQTSANPTITVLETGAGGVTVQGTGSGGRVYSNSGNSLLLGAGGQNSHLAILSNGRVSIGDTSSSANNLRLVNATAAELDLVCSNGKSFRLQSTNASAFSIVDKATNETRFHIDTSGNAGIGTTTINSDSILHLKSTQPNIYFEDTDDSKSWRLEAGSVFKVQNITTSTEAFRIDQIGTLAVGTTDTHSWNNVFDGRIRIGARGVLATTTASTQLIHNSYYDGAYKYIGNDFATRYYSNNGEHVWLTAPSGSADDTITFSSARMLITNAGKVGIGTTSPTEELHVNSTDTGNHTRVHITKTGTAGTAGVSFRSKDASNTWTLYQEDASASKFYFYDGAASVMTLDSANNRVGIGTDTPLKKLDILGGTNYDQIMVRSVGGNNTTRTGGITGINYAGNQFAMLNYYADSGQTYLSLGSMGSASYRGPTMIRFFTAGQNGTTHTETLRVTDKFVMASGGNMRNADVAMEINGPLKITNNTNAGVSQTHTNMSAGNSGKLIMNFHSIGTMTAGDTIVFTYNAISWKSWFFKIRFSSTGGYIGELWAGGYNNNSNGYQVINPRYYAAASGDGASNTTVEGATLTVTRNGQANTMTLTLNNTHVHPLFEIEYSCGGGEGYPQASRASITVNS